LSERHFSCIEKVIKEINQAITRTDAAIRRDCWFNAILGEHNLAEIILINLYSELKNKNIRVLNFDKGCILPLLEIIK
jgi:hypothetical protein